MYNWMMPRWLFECHKNVLQAASHKHRHTVALCHWILDFLRNRTKTKSTTQHHALWPSTLVHRKAVCYLLFCSPSTQITWDLTTTPSRCSNMQMTPPSSASWYLICSPLYYIADCFAWISFTCVLSLLPLLYIELSFCSPLSDRNSLSVRIYDWILHFFRVAYLVSYKLFWFLIFCVFAFGVLFASVWVDRVDWIQTAQGAQGK